jgi:hypothetical protein
MSARLIRAVLKISRTMRMAGHSGDRKNQRRKVEKRQAAQQVRVATRRAARKAARMAGCVGQVSDIDPRGSVTDHQPDTPHAD